MSEKVQYFNQNFGGYAREAFVASKALVGKSNNHKSRFIMFGRGRSGSTLLTSMLNQSKLVNCDKEIYNRPVLFPRQFLKNRSAIYPGEVYGFKLLSYQLRNQFGVEDGKRFLNELVQEQGYKLIYMKRENLVKQTLSKHYARFRGSWHESKKVNRTKMVVKVQDFIHELNEGRKLDFLEEDVLDRIPKFEVIYERDLEDNDAKIRLMDNICNFLELPTFKPEIKLKKISPKKGADYIDNWPELEQAISETEFSNFLADVT
jgi:hypothetical protein